MLKKFPRLQGVVADDLGDVVDDLVYVLFSVPGVYPPLAEVGMLNAPPLNQICGIPPSYSRRGYRQTQDWRQSLHSQH